MKRTFLNSLAVSFIGTLALLLPQVSHAGLQDLWQRVTGTQQAGKLIVVHVDVTSSVKIQDWTLYERTFEGMLRTLNPGDRIVLSTIGDQPVSKMLTVCDRTLERRHIRLRDAAAREAIIKELKTDFIALRDPGAKTAPATYVLDAVTATDQVFAQGRLQGRELVYLILSDMIEESQVANFTRKRPDGAAANKLIAQRTKAGLMPNLHDVKVYVVGAGGRSGEDMMRIKAFWESYFRAAGATLVEYGRNIVLIGKP